MRDPVTCRRPEFRPGTALRLADGQTWILPAPLALEGDSLDSTLPLVAAIAQADSRADLLRAELALGINLIAANYDLPPLILGALLDFPAGDPALAEFQTDLHQIAMDHLRAYRPALDPIASAPPAPRLPRPRHLGLFGRTSTGTSTKTKTSLSA
jgi:hypothetical protein